MNNRYLALSLALALGIPVSVQAIGLGALEVKSGLNQPLLAEIPILSANPAELEQLEVRLASPEAFARVGLERPTELTQHLQFSLSKNALGQAVIVVSTPDRFLEPYLSFLIEADWGKGRVIREYTALIDPPYIAAAVIESMQTPSVASTPTPSVSSVPAPAPAQMASATAKTEPPSQSELNQEVVSEVLPAPDPVRAEVSRAAEIGPIQPGQTLWLIAQSVQQDSGASVNQIMLAFLHANPDAFIQNNINLLKRGAVLRIPGREETLSLSASEATTLVHEQINSWRGARQPVPQPGGSVAEPREAPGVPKPATKVTHARVASSSATRIPTVSRLEIVPPSGKASAHGAQSGAAAGAGGAELRVELLQAHEDLAARTAEVAELKSRVVAMEKQNADRQRLLEMKNSQLNYLEKRLKQLAAEKIANAKSAAATQTPSEVVQVSKSSESAAAPWYFNPFILGGGSLVLIGGLAMALRRSKPELKDPVRASSHSRDEGLLANAHTDLEMSSAEDDSSDLAATIQDAYAQALEDQVRSQPKNLEAHLNLLRYYCEKHQPADFEAAAHAMRLQIKDTADPRWREVVVMGAALIPENALFSHADWNSRPFSEAPPVFAASEPVLNTAESLQPDDVSMDSMVGASADNSARVDADFGDLEEDQNDSATRLELAKAYLDIGDVEGARGILEEVLAEGGVDAKAEAGRILRQL